MGAAVATLLRSASVADDAHAEKGFRCLRELRRACVQEEEATPFNEQLRALRAELAERAARGGAELWARLAADDELRLGLISEDEVGGAGVDRAGAGAFVEAPLAPAAPASATPAAVADDDDDDFGALDD